MVSKKPLEEILFEKGKIDKKKLEQIKSLREKTGDEVSKIIVKKKFATEEEIAEAISESMGVPFIDLKNFITEPQAISAIDEKTARRLTALPLYIVKDTLTVAVTDPHNIVVKDELQLASKFKKIQLVMATEQAILDGIEENYAHGNTMEEIVKPLESKGLVYASPVSASAQKLASLAGQPPVVKFVNQMIFDALKQRASDIHIEALQESIRVRFRIDGVLHTAATISRKIHLPIVPRIKILAQMDIAESRRPQDGRFTVNVAGKNIDSRIATFPTAFGENASIRLLDKSTAILDIEDIGFSEGVLKTFKRLIKSSHGILLVTGTTGSGKTTTLYAILNRISSPEKNILTIEDPIEYLLDNVTQSQVNQKTGVDFASAMRSFLRHDPDVIMVGEIRDKETAQMAFRAALTGHLIFSTLHTNDATTAITRLNDLGLDRNMISSSIIGIVAQRLVRLICQDCKEEYKPDQTLFEDLGVEFDTKAKYYRGKGCGECNQTGYKGRIGIFELLELTDKIKICIRKNMAVEEIKEEAVRSGMRTLKQDGLEKVKKGLTTIEEVVRVTQD